MSSEVVYYGLLGAGNIGNDASFETVDAWLRARTGFSRVGAITTHPDRLQSKYGLRGWRIAIPAQSSGVVSVSIGKRLGARLLDLPRSFWLAGRGGWIVVPGMGVLEDSIRVSPGGFPLLMLSVAIACRVRGRRFILLDVGADVSTNPVTRAVFFALVRVATHVSYRDAASALAMRQERDALVAPDLVFAHPAREGIALSDTDVVIGVMRFGDEDLQLSYEEKMLELTGSLLNGGHSVLFVGGDEEDYSTARKVAEHANRGGAYASRARVMEVTTYDELLRAISAAKVVIASRYHNLVAAVSLGKPAISIGYAKKCHDLISAAGLQGYSHELENFVPSSVVDQVDELWRGHVGIVEEIRARTAGYAAEVEQLLAQVFALQ